MPNYATGDSILFQRGTDYIGFWTINKRVYFGSYGSGSKPHFQYPTPTNKSADSREIFVVAIDGCVFNGLDFTDTRFPASDKQNPSYCSEAIRINANNCKVLNCTAGNIGNGIVLNGNFNLVDSFNFSNGHPIITGNSGDYGANPITITGSNNTITHCNFTGGWAESAFYGWNGGAIEFYGTCNNNLVAFNTIIDCNGVAEFGSSGNSTADGNIIAYNQIINCGMLSYANISGQFATQVSNVQYFNNTVIENNNSRFSGTNAGLGTRYYKGTDGYLFKYGGTPSATYLYVLKNNIFWISTELKCGNGTNKISHSNNIYKSPTIAGYTLNTTELASNAGIFDGTYNLTSGSPAINFGIDIGYKNDLRGNPITGLPDAGCYEYLNTLAIDTTTHTQPPPATGITVTYTQSEITITADRSNAYAFYQLVNILGQILSKGEYRKGITRINISLLPAGLYFLKTQLNTTKIIVI